MLSMELSYRKLVAPLLQILSALSVIVYMSSSTYIDALHAKKATNTVQIRVYSHLYSVFLVSYEQD